MTNQNFQISSTTSEPLPFVKWVGGKRQLLPQIACRWPKEPFHNYYEPFLGGGAVFFGMQPDFTSILSDVNEELINTYAAVKFHCPRLINEIEHMIEQQGTDLERAEEYYYRVRELDRRDDYEELEGIKKAARFLYLNKTGFNGLYRVNSQGQCNVPFGKRFFTPGHQYFQNLINCSAALRGAVLECESFEHILYRICPDDFVYFDPPYIPDGISSTFTSYTKTGFGMSEQEKLRDLCEALDKKGVRWMLSNSSAPVMEDLYSKFNIEYVEANRSVGAKSESRKKVQETIVRNYDTSE